MHDDPTSEQVAGYFREFAATAARELPLYRRLCAGSAGDPEVVALLGVAPLRQRRPVLLLAAVHDQLLAGVDHPLAAWYSSVVSEPRPVGDAGRADDPFPAFRSFCLGTPGVAEILATRTTQTNEVGRSSALLPSLALVAAATGQPLALVELGASAGLNLAFDRYGYDYGTDGSLEPRSTSAVHLTAESRGPAPVPVPDRFPTVASRVGVDRHPVDLADPEAARWLVACQWPDQPERLQRVQAAVDQVAVDPPMVVPGDMVDDVMGLIERAAGGGSVHPCVFATWALAYLPEAEQRRLLAALDEAAGGRDLSLVFAEQPDEVPGLTALTAGCQEPVGAPQAATALVWVRWSSGRRTATHLADMHPHGRWLAWRPRAENR